jgi:hypothetical protein
MISPIAAMCEIWQNAAQRCPDCLLATRNELHERDQPIYDDGMIKE